MICGRKKHGKKLHYKQISQNICVSNIYILIMFAFCNQMDKSSCNTSMYWKIKQKDNDSTSCVFIHDTKFVNDKGQRCHPLTFWPVLWLRPVAEKKIGQDKLNNLQLYLIGCHCRELTPDNVLLISSWRSRCTPTHTVGHHCHSSMWCYTLTKQRPSKRADQYPLDKQNPRGGQAKRTHNDKRTTFT